MNWGHVSFTFLLITVATLIPALIVYISRRLHVASAPALLALMFSVGIWMYSYTLELLSADLDAKLFWAKLAYLGISTAPVAWLCFAVSFAGLHHWKARHVAPLLIIPITTTILAWTNERYGMIWHDLALVNYEGLPLLTVTYGPWFLVHVLYSYALIGFGSAILIRMAFRTQAVYRIQAMLLVSSAMVPWVGSLLYVQRVTPPYPLDVTPLTLALGILVLTWCLLRFRLLDLAPIAYDTLVRRLEDAIVVFDGQKRIVNLNPAAEQILGLSSATLIGRTLPESLPHHPLSALSLDDRETRQAEIAVTRGDVEQHYEVRSTPLSLPRMFPTGVMVTLHNVTGLKRAAFVQQFLGDVSAVLGTSLDAETTLTTLGKLALPQLGNLALLHQVEPDGRIRHVVLGSERSGGENPDDATALFDLAPAAPHGYPRVIAEAQPEYVVRVNEAYVESIARDEAHLQKLTALRLCSAMIVPLRARSRTIGALSFFSVGERGHEFDGDDHALAEEFAWRAALALDNARLYGTVQRRLVEQTTLQHVARTINSSINLDEVFETVVSQISSAFGYRLVSIYLRDEQELHLRANVGYDSPITRMPITIGVVGRVARTGEPAFVHDVAADPDYLEMARGTRQSMAVPLQAASNDVLGVLVVESTGSPWLSDDDFALLLLIADQVSVAVKNARLFSELAMSEAAAGAATRAKSAFLATMSHEIRTPMNGVLGAVQMLERTQPTEMQQEFLELARTSGDALLAVVDDILDFSKIESGQVDLQHARFDVLRCVADALQVVEVRARQKGLSLTQSIYSACPQFVIGDGGRLRQVLINLLSNAVKFTDRGSVSLRLQARSVARSQWQLLVSVHDTGIGIAPEDMDRLFVSFSQIDSAGTRRHGGSGLGLAISKRLCELMGGTMWAISEPGMGSTFSFTVVVDAVEDHAAGTVEVVTQTNGVIPSMHLPSQQPGASLEGEAAHILIVEDDATNRRLISAFVGALGYRSQVARNGREALDAIERHRFDVALLDVQMPELDGLSLARIVVQRWQRHERPRLIALTANALQGTREECLTAGMDEFLSKPVSLDTLADTLRRVLLPEPEVIAGNRLSQAFGHAPEELRSLISLFTDDAARAVADLQEAAERGDHERMAFVSHKLKSSSAMMGAMMLARACDDLEQRARSAEPAPWSDLVARIAGELRLVAAALPRAVNIDT